MARRPGRKPARADGGREVKISVGLDVDTYERLRYLMVLKRTTATAFVADLIETAVRNVTVASERPESERPGKVA
jgi:hypothetical protein